jgi:hypothetical protein
MICQTCQPRPRKPAYEPANRRVKLRPASHSYLAQPCEPLVAATIGTLSGFLILVGVWLVRLLG